MRPLYRRDLLYAHPVWRSDALGMTGYFTYECSVKYYFTGFPPMGSGGMDFSRPAGHYLDAFQLRTRFLEKLIPAKNRWMLLVDEPAAKGVGCQLPRQYEFPGRKVNRAVVILERNGIGRHEAAVEMPRIVRAMFAYACTRKVSRTPHAEVAQAGLPCQAEASIRQSASVARSSQARLENSYDTDYRPQPW